MRFLSFFLLFCVVSIGRAQETPEWKPAPGDPKNQSFLYQNGRLIGGFNHDSGYWWPWLGNCWGVATKNCPYSPPLQNFGVHMGKISGTPAYTINGKPVNPHVAYAAVDQIPNHKDHFRLTFIGQDKAKREKAQQDWRLFAAGSPYASIVDDWAVPADHWSLKDGETGAPAFIAGGDPTVYFQGPDGRVLHRQDQYEGPNDFQAIRRALDEYDHRRDPDLRRGSTWTWFFKLLGSLCLLVFFCGLLTVGIIFGVKALKKGLEKGSATDPAPAKPEVTAANVKPADKGLEEKQFTILVLTPEQAAKIQGLGLKPEETTTQSPEEEKK